jgi:hypothetical protein
MSGRTREAIETAQAAVALADETDDLTLRGDAHATLASALAVAGIEHEIAAERTIALACYETKGNVAATATIVGSGSSALPLSSGAGQE